MVYHFVFSPCPSSTAINYHQKSNPYYSSCLSFPLRLPHPTGHGFRISHRKTLAPATSHSHIFIDFLVYNGIRTTSDSISLCSPRTSRIFTNFTYKDLLLLMLYRIYFLTCTVPDSHWIPSRIWLVCPDNISSIFTLLALHVFPLGRGNFNKTIIFSLTSFAISYCFALFAILLALHFTGHWLLLFVLGNWSADWQIFKNCVILYLRR